MHFREHPVILGGVHNVTLVPMGDFVGLFDYFYEMNLIGLHFSPVPNCSERKPFIRNLYLNCSIFMIKIFVYYFIVTDICTSQLWLNGRRYLYSKSTGSIPVN